MPGNQEFAFVVLAVQHFARHGVAVDVHVSRTHKNTHLNSLVAEVFFIDGFFDYDNFSVSRTNELIITIGHPAIGDPEKRDQEKEEAKQYDEDQPA